MGPTVAHALRACTLLVLTPFAATALAQEPVPTPATSATEAIAQQAAAEPATANLAPIPVLEAELRPLTMAEVQAELDNWLAVLQAKCAQVSAAEIQAMGLDDSDDADTIQTVNERAVELRAERDQLIEHANVVISSLEEKGGDVAEARSYVASVVARPPVTGWRAGWTTVRAWLTSDEGGVALAQDFGRALAVLVAAWFLAKLLGRTLQRLLARTDKVSELLRDFALTALQRGILFFGLLVALSALGLNMGPMLAAIGALGLVIGLALQGTLSNFASGLLMMIYRPFDVGDVIDAAGTLGEVEGMTLVTTSIKTLDNQRLSIPNNMIWGDVITNVTAEDTRRVDMVFGIGYGDDVAKAKGVLMDILRSHEKVLEDPEPNVQVAELADSSVNFVVRPWVDTDDYWEVFWDVTQAVKVRFDAEGISIPFPQRDMHVYYDAGPAPGGAPPTGSPA